MVRAKRPSFSGQGTGEPEAQGDAELMNTVPLFKIPAHGKVGFKSAYDAIS